MRSPAEVDQYLENTAVFAGVVLRTYTNAIGAADSVICAVIVAKFDLAVDTTHGISRTLANSQRVVCCYWLFAG